MAAARAPVEANESDSDSWSMSSADADASADADVDDDQVPEFDAVPDTGVSLTPLMSMTYDDITGSVAANVASGQTRTDTHTQNKVKVS